MEPLVPYEALTGGGPGATFPFTRGAPRSLDLKGLRSRKPALAAKGGLSPNVTEPLRTMQVPKHAPEDRPRVSPAEAPAGPGRTCFTLGAECAVHLATAEECQRLAQECRRNAEAATDPETGNRWLNLALGWELLASGRSTRRPKDPE